MAAASAEQRIAWGEAGKRYLRTTLTKSHVIPQYEAALLRRNDPSVSAKRDAAQQACTFGTTATPDPNATIDPNAPALVPTQGIAPVGQGS